MPAVLPVSGFYPADSKAVFYPPHLVPDLDEGLQELAQMEGIWHHTLQSCDETPAPPPCSCHGSPIGACPAFMAQLVHTIVQCNLVSGANMDGARIPIQCPSFDASVWKAALGKYFDAGELVAALYYGWDMDFTVDSPKPKDAIRNNASAMQFPEHVDHYVEKEQIFGSLVGPFEPGSLPFPFYRSPFGSVLKVKSKWRRTVTDCSQLDLGINAYIDPSRHRSVPWKLTLPNSMAIINEIVKVRARHPGQRIFLWKIDMARWYRWHIMDPKNVPYFAVQWRGKVFLDRCLSFGNRESALAAQRFIWAISWIYRTQIPPHSGTYNSGFRCCCSSHCDCGDNSAKPYIDDVIGASAQALANDNFSSFLALADHLGLRLSTTPGHVSPPGPICIALGLEYDTDLNTVSLPRAKRDDLSKLLKHWLDTPKATEKELASISGKLLQACGVIFAGRLFLNRILATKRRATRATHKTIYLDEAFRDDVQWWLEALDLRNGVSFLVQKSTATITLDASTTGWSDGSPGIGAYNFDRNEFISVSPPQHLHQLHINDLELLAHVLVARIWGPQMDSVHVKVFTDNTCCWYLSQNGRSAVDQRLRMARIFALSQIEHNYRVEPAWLSTDDNWLADAYSRPADDKSKTRIANFVKSIGVNPTQRHIEPEMYNF